MTNWDSCAAKIENWFAKLQFSTWYLFDHFACGNIRKIFVIGNIWGKRSKIQSDSLRPLSREDSPSVEFFGGKFARWGIWATLTQNLVKKIVEICQKYLYIFNTAIALYFGCKRSSGNLFGQSGKRGFSFKSSHKSWSTHVLSVSKRAKKTNSKNTFIM